MASGLFSEENSMRRSTIGLACTAAVLAATAAKAQDTVKIGVVMSFSGQFADTGTQIGNGIKLYMKQNGDTVAGKKIQIINKDSGGIAPDVAKRLSQEVIVRDGAKILAGYDLTPNAMAAADVSAQAKTFMVDMNAATSVIITKSPYMVRTSFTVWMLNEELGKWAYKNGVRKAYTLVDDYGPGWDGEAAFTKGFKDAGGEIVGAARYPTTNLDFTAFLQRAKDSNPDGIYIWVPGGTQPAAIGKAIAERSIDKTKVKIMGQGELTNEDALKSMGDAGIGLITAFHYDFNHQSEMNKKFVADYNAEFHRNPDMFSVGGYDGMHLIYEALKKTNGNADGQAMVDAAKGMKWESPRGPMSINPETRDVMETVYIRRVEKVDGKLVNVEFDKMENAKDPWVPRNMKK
jgi:branched-chain amino acid transport system substrate-binding protein